MWGPALIPERWAWWSYNIRNAKSPTLNPQMTEQVKQRPTVPLDDTSSSVKDEEAIRGMANRTAAGPDEVPV